MLNKSFLQALAVVAGFTALQANAVIITNGSFEDGVDGTLVYGHAYDQLATNDPNLQWGVYTGLIGWQKINPNVTGAELNYSGNLGFDAKYGNHYLELDTHFDYANPGNSNSGIMQNLTNLTAGATYELSFWYRARTDIADSNGINIFWQDGSNPLDMNNVFDKVDLDLAKGNLTNWVEYKFNVKATSSTMNLGFAAFGDAVWAKNTQYNPNNVGNGDAKGGLMDGIAMKQVPAPAPFALFGLAAVALLARRRKV